MSVIRTKWAAVGAAVAVTLGAGGISMTQAAISSGVKPVFIALDAPCRVVDTREDAKIGAGDAAALTVQITGENRDCSGALAIPADAVGVSTNVTVIQPSDAASGRSYFTVYPTGANRPTTSNLNFVNGQAPTPNKVDVGIGTGGRITIYNDEGTAHAAVDIFGYYIDHHHDDRYSTEAEVDTALATKADAADVYTKAQTDAAIDDANFAPATQTMVVQPYMGALSAGMTSNGNDYSCLQFQSDDSGTLAYPLPVPIGASIDVVTVNAIDYDSGRDVTWTLKKGQIPDSTGRNQPTLGSPLTVAEDDGNVRGTVADSALPVAATTEDIHYVMASLPTGSGVVHLCEIVVEYTIGAGDTLAPLAIPTNGITESGSE